MQTCSRSYLLRAGSSSTPRMQVLVVLGSRQRREEGELEISIGNSRLMISMSREIDFGVWVGKPRM